MSKKPKVFKFAGYEISPETNKIIFKYETGFYNSESLFFSEIMILTKKTKVLKDKNIYKFLEPLSLILGISYYKLYCPPEIDTVFKILKEQPELWSTLYTHSL